MNDAAQAVPSLRRACPIGGRDQWLALAFAQRLSFSNLRASVVLQPVTQRVVHALKSCGG
ncbi:hypothetical protein [Metallibacterium sp.]|uniref:hypothetical protein n=1 Tax=Metallibacterium sp. TaxID=2940281 RepID=UPI0026197D1D|nr:hypothetical protein [Metallibacterium sp.]